MLEIVTGYLNSFLRWGTHSTVVPYIPTVLILALGFIGMWSKAQWATIPHELGHAFMALLLGKRLSGININKDSSGDTRTMEARPQNFVIGFFTIPFRWARNILVSFAGYPGPFLLAFGLIYFWSKDQAKIGMILIFVLLFFTFLYSTNLFGFLLVLGGLIITGLALWINSPILAEVFVVFLAGGMLAGGIKGIQEAWQVYQQDTKTSAERWADPFYEPQHSDARVLSRRTLIPQIVWLLVFSGTGVVLTLLTLQRLVMGYHF